MSVEGCPLNRLPPHVVDGGPSAIIQVGVVWVGGCGLNVVYTDDVCSTIIMCTLCVCTVISIVSIVLLMKWDT